MHASRYDYVRARIPSDTLRVPAWYDVPLLRTLLLDHKYGYVFKMDGAHAPLSPLSNASLPCALHAACGCATACAWLSVTHMPGSERRDVGTLPRRAGCAWHYCNAVCACAQPICPSTRLCMALNPDPNTFCVKELSAWALLRSGLLLPPGCAWH